jgi:hypothetical protein
MEISGALHLDVLDQPARPLVLQAAVEYVLEIRKAQKTEKAPGGAHALSMSRIPPGAKKRMARLFEADRAHAEHWK